MVYTIKIAGNIKRHESQTRPVLFIRKPERLFNKGAKPIQSYEQVLPFGFLGYKY